MGIKEKSAAYQQQGNHCGGVPFDKLTKEVGQLLCNLIKHESLIIGLVGLHGLRPLIRI
jgi:hypothetical protein